MSIIDPRSFTPENIDWSITLADRIKFWEGYVKLNPNHMATIDFETRSACNLKAKGSWQYARDKSTEAMCLAYLLPGVGQEVELWHAGYSHFMIDESPAPTELFAYILAGGLVEAHNVFFERVIWFHVMHKRHKWPLIPPYQLRCSAAKCSAHALPRDLGTAAIAMGVSEEKDVEGRKLMLKMSKPRKPRKAEVEEWQLEHGKKVMPPIFHETEEDLARLWSYCKQDVITEHALSGYVPELSREELLVWQMDQDMNWKGAKFDVALAKAALAMADRYKAKLNGELEIITGIEAGTKRAQIVEWLLENENLELPDTTKDTLEWYVERVEMSGRARRIIEIMMQVNKTSTRKFTAILNYADSEDSRIRDLLMYHGAGTGRWAGKGVQVQNFPKGEFDDFDMDECCQWVLDGELEWIETLYTDVLAFLSAIIRGTIIPEDGRDFMVADYSAIEARVVLWLANAEGALDVFRRGDDIYCDMASGIYGRHITKADKQERQFGKQAVLGLGYGMGFITFLLTCRKYKIHFSRDQVLGIMGIEKLLMHESWITNYLRLDGDPLPRPGMTPDEVKKQRASGKIAAISRRRIVDAREDPRAIVHELALMRYTVQVYRARYPQVKDMWTEQEQAAIKAVIDWQDAVKIKMEEFPEISFEEHKASTPGVEVDCGKVTWFVAQGGKFLHCRLPSGRLLSYVDPRIKWQETPWGEKRPALRYMRMGMANKWERTATYGGKFVENITQAVARDIMASAMVEAWQDSPYDTIASIHDELVCEVDQGVGSEEEFEALMGNIKPWAEGCPITAEAVRFRRYRK